MWRASFGSGATVDSILLFLDVTPPQSAPPPTMPSPKPASLTLKCRAMPKKTQRSSIAMAFYSCCEWYASATTSAFFDKRPVCSGRKLSAVRRGVWEAVQRGVLPQQCHWLRSYRSRWWTTQVLWCHHPLAWTTPLFYQTLGLSSLRSYMCGKNLGYLVNFVMELIMNKIWPFLFFTIFFLLRDGFSDGCSLAGCVGLVADIPICFRGVEKLTRCSGVTMILNSWKVTGLFRGWNGLLMPVIRW